MVWIQIQEEVPARLCGKRSHDATVCILLVCETLPDFFFFLELAGWAWSRRPLPGVWRVKVNEGSSTWIL
jgi:hypothetical protein